MARRVHPDVNPGSKLAEEAFKTLVEAYEVLSNPERRSQYDASFEAVSEESTPQVDASTKRDLEAELSTGVA